MSYSNYSTYLKYKNCCRPIGDTGPPGPPGPTGPSGPTISGNKGEIIYFSETDNLVSTNNIFIQEGNVTINNNLIVTGNLSMNNQFINDVSGIYFSDGTYIGYGSSFDITTSERLDISAAGGVTVNGNLLVKDAATFQSDTTITGNLTIDGATTIDNTLEVNGNAIISGNLSMSDQFINDVSGIYFSDGTYIGYGSSFDITTSERLDISAAGGVTVTGNLFIDSATTLNGNLNFKTAGHISSSASSIAINTVNLNIDGATTIDNTLIVNDAATLNGNLNFKSAGHISSSSSSTIAINTVNLNIDADTIIDKTLTVHDATTLNGNLNFKSADHISSSGSSIAINTVNLNIDAATTINGNLSMSDQFINDVSGIYFSDGTYIGVGSSFDITTSQTLDISADGGLTVTGNLLVKDAATFQYDINLNGNLLFNSGPHISSSGSSINVYANHFNIASSLTKIKSNLSMNNNFINHVSGIYFTKGNLLFSDFSSVNQSVQLPSSQGQPISLERKTLITDSNFNKIITTGNTIIDFSNSSVKTHFNQLDLNLNGNVISPSPDISGQFVEMYANFDISFAGGGGGGGIKTFSLDISSVSGDDFYEVIDARYMLRTGNFYLTFGPHIFIPNEWNNTTGFNIIINNTGTTSFQVNKYKLMFKSYFI